jgi:hypothetical protein
METLRLNLQSQEDGHLYHEIRIPFRKTKQTDEHGTIYEFHPTPAEPEICAYTAINRWLEYLKEVTKRDTLKPTDYLFPFFKGNTVRILSNVRLVKGWQCLESNIRIR